MYLCMWVCVLCTVCVVFFLRLLIFIFSCNVKCISTRKQRIYNTRSLPVCVCERLKSIAIWSQICTVLKYKRFSIIKIKLVGIQKRNRALNWNHKILNQAMCTAGAFDLIGIKNCKGWAFLLLLLLFSLFRSLNITQQWRSNDTVPFEFFSFLMNICVCFCCCCIWIHFSTACYFQCIPLFKKFTNERQHFYTQFIIVLHSRP